MDSNIFRLDGKVALVTGASYGIGMAMAKALAEAGATIVFNDRNPDRITEALAEYRRSGIDARGYLFDVTDEKAV
ncbi:MAG: SDR family NAD(P)-dependent oxidoreductase, partial [Bacteroidetes bacterium]